MVDPRILSYQLVADSDRSFSTLIELKNWSDFTHPMSLVLNLLDCAILDSEICATYTQSTVHFVMIITV